MELPLAGILLGAVGIFTHIYYHYYLSLFFYTILWSVEYWRLVCSYFSNVSIFIAIGFNLLP